MTMLLDGRLRDLATQTHLLEKKVDALGWMAANGPQTLKSMTRAQARVQRGGPAPHLRQAEGRVGVRTARHLPQGWGRVVLRDGGARQPLLLHPAQD